MQYTFKALPELAWGLGVAIAVAVATELATVDVATFNEPMAWVAATSAGVARAIGGFILAKLGPKTS